MRVWRLNLSAELELEGRAPTRAVLSAERKFATVVARTLLPAEDRLLTEVQGSLPPETQGRAWCATPSAVQALGGAGAMTHGPPIDVLRTANSRAFSHALEPWRAHYIRHRRELTFDGPQWLKSDFAFAGRGHRSIGSTMTDSDEKWLAGALRRGGIRVEPRVTILQEAGTPGYVPRGNNSPIHVGRPVRQVCDRGRWHGSEGTLEDATTVDLLRATCLRVGLALQELGYFGPYGVDAFESPEGWNTLSEINARYSMGWALGWTDFDVRPDLAPI